MAKLAGPFCRRKHPARASGAAAEKIPFKRTKQPAASFRRAAKRPTALRDPRCPAQKIQSRRSKRKSLRACSSAVDTIPSWGAKRVRSALVDGGGNPPLSGRSRRCPSNNKRCVHHLDHFRLAPSWGAKRARSALDGGGGNPAHSGCSLPRLNNSGSCCTRDWANLEDGPAGLIAELALANDVADYVRFRAVCRPWRQCSPDPRTAGLDGRFLPRRWMMLDKALAGPRLLRFLNVSTGECIRMDLPELAEHTLLALTPEGLLLLLHEPSLVVRLLNPLTRQLTDLPPVTALLTPEQQRARRWGHKLGESIRVDGVGLVVDASTAAVRFHYPTVLAVAKPGDESWTVVDHGYINSVLPFGGRFYCATYNGVVVLNISSDQQMACLRMAVERSRSLINFSALKDSLHLVDNGRELMLVHRMLCPGNDAEDDVEDDAEDDVEDDAEDDGNYKMKYEVYRVDLNAGILIPVKSFNGQAVFMGRSRTISISAEAFPSVAADTLYMGFDCDEKRRMDGYNLADGSNEPCHYDPSVAGRVQPSTLIDCLSYCVRGIGKQLA